MNPLRRLFGPSRTEIWRQLCADTGATYLEGGFWKGDRVQATHGEWTIILDVYFCAASKMEYTRLRAPYVNPDRFRFTIYRRGFFSDIAKRLGMQDIEVGHGGFDRDFIIQGTDAAKVRSLFDHARIRELIEAQPQIHLAVTDASDNLGVHDAAVTDELHFHVPGVIKDPDRLKLLFELFAETLDQLCRIGSAYEPGPPPAS